MYNEHNWRDGLHAGETPPQTGSGCGVLGGHGPTVEIFNRMGHTEVFSFVSMLKPNSQFLLTFDAIVDPE